MRKKGFVLLDLDDTILDFQKAERGAFCAAFSSLGVEPTEELMSRYHQINLRCWEMLERGEMSREKILVHRFRLLFEERGLPLSPEETQRRYEEYLCRGHFFIPGAEALLAELHGKYPLYLLSNGNMHTQEGRLRSAGIAPFFEGIFISEAMGHNKPSRAYFDACFAQIPGFDATRAVMVGDSLTSDILGGINAGVKTCWFNPHGMPGREDIRPDHEIRALAELPPLLEKIFA